MRDLLGGKGANVAEMTRVLGAERVPAGFTITTEACVAFLQAGSEPPELEGQVDEALERLQEAAGKRLGDPDDPAAGVGALGRARVDARDARHRAQPGAATTRGGRSGRRHGGRALRLGLLPALRADVRQRRVRRAGRAVRGADRRAQARAGREAGHRAGRRRPARADRALRGGPPRGHRRGRSPPTRATSCARRSARCSSRGPAIAPCSTGASTASPTTGAPRSTCSRWCSATAATTSGSGVAFSRDEITGAPEPSGDFLIDAQGEDVVSGVRNTRDLGELAELMPDDPRASCWRSSSAWRATTATCRTWSSRSRRGACTCCRRAAPSARRRRRCASRSTRWGRGCWTRRRRWPTIDAETLDALLHPTFDPSARYEVLTRGVAASPGAARGRGGVQRRRRRGRRPGGPRRGAGAAVHRGRRRGRLPRRARASSPARAERRRTRRWWRGAWAARACAALRSWRSTSAAAHGAGGGDGAARRATRSPSTAPPGDVTTDDVPLVQPEMGQEFATVLGWADELRRLGVRTNADTPEDARRAREFGRRGHRPVPHRAHVLRRRPRARWSRRCSWPPSAGAAPGPSWRGADDEREPAARERFEQADGEFLKGAGGAAGAPARRLRADLRRDERAAGDDPPARPAAARVPARRALPRRRRAAGGKSGGRGRQALEARAPRPGAGGVAERGQPDAGHARQPAGDPVPAGVRDAGAGDRAGGAGGGGPRRRRPRWR